jgi:hypothetical protein
MKAWFKVLSAFALLPAVAPGAQTQVAQSSEEVPEHPAVAMVRFECVWEPATPQDYVVKVQQLGSATYLSRNPLRPPPEGVDPDFHLQFTLSPANLSRVFKLAEQASYFNGTFDYKKHQVANTGTKTLIYADAARHSQTTYNWSENTAIDQLTRLFEGISSTIEHGRRLQFLHRFDRLGLEAELKAMEDMAGSHYLAEIQIIAPTLQTIADDPAVMNIARQRARRLLDLAGKETGENMSVKAPQ